ncbi:unnamed protein product, partial [Chrysoparadoxa australica]
VLAFDQFQNLDFDHEFDFMFAFSVLIHLEDSISEACFQFVSKYLKADGTFFANVNIEQHDDAKWQGFPVVFRTLDFYEKMAAANGLKVRNMGQIKDFGHISGQDLADKQVMLEIKKA